LKPAAILCLLLIAVSAAAESPWIPKAAKGYEVKEGRIFFRSGQAGLMLESVDGEAIARYYSDRGARVGNPLLRLGPEVEQGVIFLLTIFNRSEGNVTFTPNYALLRVKDDTAFAMDFTVLVGLMDSVDPALRKILDKSIFHSPEILSKGEVVSKFLIFPSIPPKVKELRLDMDSLFFEGKDVRKTFQFTKRP